MCISSCGNNRTTYLFNNSISFSSSNGTLDLLLLESNISNEKSAINFPENPSTLNLTYGFWCIRILSSWYFDNLSNRYTPYIVYDVFQNLYYDIDFREITIYIMFCYFSYIRILINRWFNASISYDNILPHRSQMNLAQHSIYHMSHWSSLAIHAIEISQRYTSHFLSNNVMDKI